MEAEISKTMEKLKDGDALLRDKETEENRKIKRRKTMAFGRFGGVL